VRGDVSTVEFDGAVTIGPYDGVRVIELSGSSSGAAATQVLADLGADVIVVESPAHSELQREGVSLHWAAHNRNKRSLSVDLDTEEGATILRALVGTADIVTSDRPHPQLVALGVDHDSLRVEQPGVISGRLLAGSPPGAGDDLIGYVTGMHFAQGLMAALAAREQTGLGQVVEAGGERSELAMRSASVVALLDADPEANLVEGMEWGAEHPVAGRLRLVALPVTLTETPGRVYSPPPRLGDDNAAILEEIGYSLDDTLDLFDAGVLGGERPPEEG
jgi:crotonobetainyl-CoA:carnitine CoA-transferase CaiB-like acyl-CoA transferase